MYNKISSIILNSGKASNFSDVFVAQPDSLKESLAGKIFIVADIGGKKIDGKNIFDFLISSLNNNYYNDEKILLRDKIEGLKVENIFEAAISKTNKSLNEFLVAEKIKLNTSTTNLTIGVVFENNLYFSSFGKNRSLLIYRHNDQYEIINVEANASDINSANESSDRAVFNAPSFFSSVISGEMPIGSYFVFTSEALPEYISAKDMIAIITKLPPIVAAEQIKNILVKINSFIPFLGVIIKNTLGSDNQEVRDEIEENLSAHSSISSLNYTEQKTERMLEPAGLISFSKIYNNILRFVKDLKPKHKIISKKVYRPDEDRQSNIISSISDSEINPVKVKSLNLARVESFLIKEQIFFKKKPSLILSQFGHFFSNIYNAVNFKKIYSAGQASKNWLSGLNKNNRSLLIGLGAVIFIFVASLGVTSWNKKRLAAQNNYNNLVTTIEEKQSEIDNYLAYGNEDGAKNSLIEVRNLLSYLPKEKKDQALIYSRFEENINSKSDKIEKVIKIESPEKINDLSGSLISNIVWADGIIYASGLNTVYSIIPKYSSSSKFSIIGADNLLNPQFDKKSIIYYFDSNKIAKFDLKNKQSNIINISSEGIQYNSPMYGLFNAGKYLYTLSKEKNQIYRYICSNNSCSAGKDWFKEGVDLSLASDFFVNSVDGRLYILNTNGEVKKFYTGKMEAYSSSAILPTMTSASKIVVGVKYIYIFEASSKRLAVMSIKDGGLMNQYQVSSLNNLKDFAIDEINKTAYFLDGEIIYKISLSQ